MSRGIVRPGRIGPKFEPKEVRLPFCFDVAGFSQLHKMDLNRSIIRSEVRQALEEYLQSNTDRSAKAGRLEGSCKLILLCTSLLMLSL